MRVTTPLVGLFVGGRSRRMGGAPKALLPAPDGSGATLIDRTARVVREAGCELVLVGDAPWLGERLAGVARVRDAVQSVGPIAGLAALLREAKEREIAAAIALACDMPFVDARSIERLAHTPSNAAVLAPRARERGAWEAMFARYECDRVGAHIELLLKAGRHAMQAIFDGVTVEEMILRDDERALLRDWDEPRDREG